MAFIMKSMYKGIIFDFDGVIVDSEVRYVESVIAYLKTLGIDSHFDELTYLIGQNMSDIYMCLKRQFDLDVSKESFIEGRGTYLSRGSHFAEA